jgi:type IV pilus biogenesis protein PilP
LKTHNVTLGQAGGVLASVLLMAMNACWAQGLPATTTPGTSSPIALPTAEAGVRQQPAAAQPGRQVGANADQGTKSHAKRLAELQAENQLLDWEAKNAKLRDDIRKAKLEQGTASPQGTAASLQQPLPASLGGAVGAGVGRLSPVGSMRASEGLEVLSIKAYEGRFVAWIDVGGRVQDVRRGDKLEGGWSVSAIDDSTVKLMRNGRVRILTY